MSAASWSWQKVREHKVRLLPVDSEHSAILQCLQGEDIHSVNRLILTASGGPFLNTPREEMDAITPARALKHPTWTMGSKITIDSATLMNKGLEVIEAHWLFGLPAERIEVIVHPQSIIHSMVEFVDGSVKAQLGIPGYEAADPVCAHVSRTSTVRVSSGWILPRSDGSRSRIRTWSAFPVCPLPSARCAKAERHRRS